MRMDDIQFKITKASTLKKTFTKILVFIKPQRDDPPINVKSCLISLD